MKGNRLPDLKKKKILGGGEVILEGTWELSTVEETWRQGSD